jgi:hypothetical protein
MTDGAESNQRAKGGGPGDREASVAELDLDHAIQNAALVMGAVWVALGQLWQTSQDNDRLERLLEWHWIDIPFHKALCELAKENPSRARELWAQALREPMPFAGKPLGMPRVPK